MINDPFISDAYLLRDCFVSGEGLWEASASFGDNLSLESETNIEKKIHSFS